MILGTHLLGRTVEHDPASWNYRHPVRTITQRRNVIHTLGAPCLDQGTVGSCEGNTGVEWTNTSAAIRNRRKFWDAVGSHGQHYLAEPQAVGLYSAATRLDDDGIATVYPPDDTGTSGVGIAKAMQAAGIIGAYDWTFTFEAFLAVLQIRAVMLGTNWYRSMFDPNASGVVTIGRGDVDPDGGHAYLGLAIDWTRERIGCQNHWTADWGIKIGGRPGRFWLPFATAERLLSEQGDSLVPRLVVA